MVLVGDWNVNATDSSQKTVLVRELARQFRMKVVTRETPTLGIATLDFALLEAVMDVSNIVVPSPPDHRCLILEFNVGVTRRCNLIVITNKGWQPI